MKRIGLLSAVAISASMFFVSCGGEETAKTEVKEEVKIEEVAPVVKEEVVVATADLTNGEEVYNKSCFACHNTAAGGAALLDDNERWTATAAKGLEAVNNNALVGYTGKFGIMLPKGGNAAFTDVEVTNAVAYMLDKAGVVAN